MASGRIETKYYRGIHLQLLWESEPTQVYQENSPEQSRSFDVQTSKLL